MRPFQTIALSLAIATAGNASAAPGLNSLEIAEKTLSCIDCIDWKPLGICQWIRCSLTGCSFSTTLKVEHYVPDLVVSTYTTESAYTEVQGINPTPISATSITNSWHNEETFLDFKNAEVFSNPTVVPFNEGLGQLEFFCRTPLEIPLVPYYLSAIDPMWADGTLERLLPRTWLTPTYIETDQNTNIPVLGPGRWANEYPRSGFGNHQYDPINAAVAAHRAVHIVERPHQLHIYQHADGPCRDKCWKPAPLSADPEDQGYEDNRFQMLYPVHENDAKAFGGPASWANDKVNEQEIYLWSVWRKYQCCRDRGTYLGTISFE